MYSRSIILIAVALALTSCALPSESDQALLEGEPRRELYQATSKSEIRAAHADVYSIWRDDLRPRHDGNYDLLSVPFTTVDESPTGRPLCPDASFYGQPRLYTGASGILVGEDLMLTAAHTLATQEVCDARALVVDHAIAAPPASDTALPIIPAANVFFCVEVVATGWPSSDWTVVRLDRRVDSERIPLKVRREGTMAAGTPALLAGHPHRLPLKLEATTGTGGPYSVFGPGTIAVGNSGSMVLNGVSRRVEGVIVSGYLPSPVLDPELGCYRECVNCGGTFSATPADRFAAFVPPIGLEVAPVAPISHYGPPGGPFSDPTINYTLSAGATGRATQWSATGTDDGLFTIGPVLARASIPPGRTQNVSVILNQELAATLPNGAHEASIRFDDRTYFTRDDRSHRVVVGIEGFEVGHPDDGRVLIYPLQNRWEVAQRVLASAEADWLALDASSFELPPRSSDARQPALTVSLAYAPTPGAETTLTFHSRWYTETHHVLWDGTRLVAVD